MAWRTSLLPLVVACVACSGSTRPTFEDPTSGGGAAGDEATAGFASGGSKATAGTAGAGSDQGGASGVGGTSNHDQPDCDSAFEQLDKTCDSVDDCELVEHQIDCCGTILVMGIAATAAPGFSAVEEYCAAKFPLCGCAAQGVKLEDGTLVDFGSSAYAVECIEHRCTSRSTAAPSPCGPDHSCTASQYCSQFSGGPAGSEPSYSCKALGDCHDCACLDVGPGCQCSETGGAITVSCFAP